MKGVGFPPHIHTFFLGGGAEGRGEAGKVNYYLGWYTLKTVPSKKWLFQLRLQPFDHKKKFLIGRKNIMKAVFCKQRTLDTH